MRSSRRCCQLRSAFEAPAERAERLLELPGARPDARVVVAHVDLGLRGVVFDSRREVAKHVMRHELRATDHLTREAHDGGGTVEHERRALGIHAELADGVVGVEAFEHVHCLESSASA